MTQIIQSKVIAQAVANEAHPRSLEKFFRIFSSGALNGTDEHGRIGLMYAAAAGKLEVAFIFLLAGQTAETKDTEGANAYDMVGRDGLGVRPIHHTPRQSPISHFKRDLLFITDFMDQHNYSGKDLFALWRTDPENFEVFWDKLMTFRDGTPQQNKSYKRVYAVINPYIQTQMVAVQNSRRLRTLRHAIAGATPT